MAKILLVDDSDQLLMLLTKALEGEGHEVVSVEDGSRVREALRTHGKFDLLITDIVMPEREGLEVIIDVRKTNTDMKIIAMSGGGRIGAKDYLTIAKRLGAAGTIEKPFKVAEFLQVVRETLK